MGYIGKQPTKVPLTSEDIVDESIESADIKEGTIVNSDINAAAGIVTSKVTGAVTSITSHGLATSATTDTTNADNISSGTVGSARLGTGTADTTKFLRGDGSWQVVAIPSLDTPVITGTLSVLDSGTVTHTIANWSDDITYTITPTNCTAGAINGSGEFVITHTSGAPSYTILATTASLGLDDSDLVTKNITMTLSAPTLSSPADVGTAEDVVYTITSTTTDDDKLILDIGSSNFTFQSVSVGSASKVGNTVECTGFTTNNPAVTIRFTAEATYSVTAKAVKIDGSYGTSANSSADSITIQNFVGTVADESSQPGLTVSTDGDYKVHKFLTTGTFTVTTAGTEDVEYMIVAGGGGGGGWAGGGGGGGGYRTATDFTVVAQEYTITVGAGGSGSSAGYPATGFTNGDVSSIAGPGISTIESAGGGHGGEQTPGAVPYAIGNTGGSGGGPSGSGSGPTTGVAGNTPSTDPSQGYPSGAVTRATGWVGAGGGGAGGVGGTVTSTHGGAGGVGAANDIINSAIPAVYYAGGGGGGEVSLTAGAGGNGGGGPGGTNVVGVDGTDGLGGGGGGAGATGTGSPDNQGGGDGGDGIVVIRYKFQ